MMDSTIDHLVTTDAQSGLIITRGVPISSYISEEPVLDLSQRATLPNRSTVIIDNWTTTDSIPLSCSYSDTIDDEIIPKILINNEEIFNLQQSLTDQIRHKPIREDSMSDSSTINQSKFDFELVHHSNTRLNSSIQRRHVIHKLSPSIQSNLSTKNFIWSRYFSRIGERSVSDEFFDHYLASIESNFHIDMKLEYCYDITHELYWLTQIQFVAHSLLRLHYVGLPEDDISSDFWADAYGKRCHPIGWCRDNSKLMLPPPIVTKRAIQQTAITTNSSSSTTTTTITNGNEKLITIKTENTDVNPEVQTPPVYLFDKDVGLTPAEQLKSGMLLELQDAQRPWTVWFVRIINNRGGRLHLRYIVNGDDNNNDLYDIHLFYLDWRVHNVGWVTTSSFGFNYELPSCFIKEFDKQIVIDQCHNENLKQFLPKEIFKEQEEIPKHRFIENMKLEIFDQQSQHVYVGYIGQIYNEYFFDVHIIDDDNNNQDENENKKCQHKKSFVSYATYPYLLPPQWASQHKLTLMKGTIRQSEDYWKNYSEKNGISDLAPERCFHLITLNATGANRVEPGMKMEMICSMNDNHTDRLFSVTLIHIADHLMWVRVDNPLSNENDYAFYHVIPINSLNVFPVGWARYHNFELIPPNQFEVEIETCEQDRYELFSSVTYYPRIPRIYLTDVYILTLFVNIRCFSGPHFCSSRLSRLPAQFGPGPYRLVLVEMFHRLISIASANGHRALRRLDRSSNIDAACNMTTEHIKIAKKSPRLVRAVSIPTDPRSIRQFLRHICTQLEVCPNLISMTSNEDHCPDKCHILTSTFAFSTHSKHRRPGPAQLRWAQNRHRKQKSLLCHLKNGTIPPAVTSPLVEELPPIEPSPSSETTTTTTIMTTTTTTTVASTNDISPPSVPLPPPGSDRRTRGFRVHIEPRTHTVTRTNKKQKLMTTSTTVEIPITTIKQEPMEVNNNITSEASSSSSSSSTKESKRFRASKKKRPSSPLPPAVVSPPPPSSTTLNILSSSTVKTSSPSSTNKKKRRINHSLNDLTPSSPTVIPKVEPQQQSPPSPLIRPTFPIDTRNPVTWNVNDVCWYLNESGCSFALKTIKEQEIDGAALLLLDDLPTVQDLLEFKLGPAVKFCHVVEQLRTQVIDTFHSSPSLKNSRLTTPSSSSSS